MVAPIVLYYMLNQKLNQNQNYYYLFTNLNTKKKPHNHRKSGNLWDFDGAVNQIRTGDLFLTKETKT